MAKEKIGSKFRTYKDPAAVSLAAPAVRLFLLVAREEEFDDLPPLILPVVSLRSRSHRTYYRRFDKEAGDPVQPWDRSPTGLDPDWLLAQGWQVAPVETSVDDVLVAHGAGLVDGQHFRELGCRTRVVACPWPAKEDAERLAIAVAELADWPLKRARSLTRSLGLSPSSRRASPPIAPEEE